MGNNKHWHITSRTARFVEIYRTSKWIKIIYRFIHLLNEIFNSIYPGFENELLFFCISYLHPQPYNYKGYTG